MPIYAARLRPTYSEFESDHFPSDPFLGTINKHMNEMTARWNEPMLAVKDNVATETVESNLEYAGLRMLCVDDESTFVDTYKKYFSKRGFEVDTATSLKQYEQLLRQRHHHVILLDYYLDSDKIGGDVLLSMAEEHDRDATVVVVTGRPSLETAVASLRQRAFDYLSKPVKIDDLARSVNRALEAKGLLRMSAGELQRKIGERIREGRKSKSLTLAQLADRTGLSVGFLSQIELGKNSASVDTLYRIATALGVQPGDFFRSE